MRFCFVSTRQGSHFMTELLSAISVATAASGYGVELVFDEFPPLGDERVYVVVPHEFRAWGNPDGFPDVRQRARTIALCTENPGTPWFEETCQLAPHFAAAVSINRSSAAELRRRGIRCEHVQLGYSPQWDTWLGDEDARRNIDVLYLGAADPRRDPLLGGFGKDLWARRCQFLIPPLEPRTRPRPDFLTGAEKYQRLRSAQILLNLHRTTSSALEWMRFLEAICNGCVVVSEPCLDGDPLIPGEHFIEVPVERMASTADRLLDEPDRLQLMRRRAYDFVREELPMQPAGKRLAELAAELPRNPPPRADAPFPKEIEPVPALPLGSQPVTSSAADEARPHATQSRPKPQWAAADPSALGADGGVTRRLLHKVADRLPRRRRSPAHAFQQTSSYAAAKPRVTVVLATAQDVEQEAVAALASVASSRYRELELLLLDDAFSERPASLEAFLADHPSLAARRIRRPLDCDLGSSRNMLATHARGEHLFTLNATGGIYPSTLQRLVTALDADPQATFCYPMVAIVEEDRPVALASSLPWEPERLQAGNWIDAMALVRRTHLLALGGYATDPRLAGSEDLDLWRRCAAAGGYGVHVPQVLAWHRRIT